MSSGIPDSRLPTTAAPLDIASIKATGIPSRLAPDMRGFQRSLDSFLKEIHQKTERQYAEARLAALLLGKVDDSDLVSLHDDYVLVLVPEASPARMKDLAKQLSDATRRELGFSLRVGSSFFPNEEVTLAGLVDRAVSQMSNSHMSNSKSNDGTRDNKSELENRRANRAVHVETNIAHESSAACEA